MNFTQAVSHVFKNYANFSGRASLAEFWWWALFVLIIQGIIWGIFALMGGYDWIYSVWNATMSGATEIPAAGGGLTFLAIVSGLISIVFLIPNLSVTTRRFHDRGFSGFWLAGLLVACLIPYIGFLTFFAILVICALQGNSGDNKYGPAPVA